MDDELDQLRNEHFGETIARNRLAPLMTEFFQRSARRGFSVSSSDLDEIRRARAQSARLVDETFDMMEQQAIRRRDNLERFRRVRVLSLGEDCMARSLTVRWGLRKFAAIGERSGPFDLAVHPIASATRLLANGFDGYMDPEVLAFRPRQNFCVNTRYGVRFNHDAGPEFAENDFALLREAYTRRIGVLRAALSSPDPVVLVVHPNRAGSADAAALTALLEAVGPGQRLLLCIDTWKPGEMPAPGGVRDIAPGIRGFGVEMPGANYVWHRPEQCFGPAGFAFEARIVAFLEQAITEAFPAHVGASGAIAPGSCAATGD